MRIDAHHHFWQLGRYEYPWMTPDLVALHHDFGPQELEPALDRHVIESTVLVQTIRSVDETRWFLSLAGQHNFVAGVVGWVDLTDPHVGTLLDELREDPLLVGIRHPVHDEPDDAWLLRDDVRRGLRELAIRSLPYDLLLRPQHLSAALQIARSMPELPLVIDHLAKPRIAARKWDGWAEGIKQLAGCPNVYCKLSGMITEADWHSWQPADLKPYIDHALECFGPGRLMYGSDWPVCLLAGTYDQVFEACQQNLSALSPTEQDQILGSTAQKFYQLQRCL